MMNVEIESHRTSSEKRPIYVLYDLITRTIGRYYVMESPMYDLSDTFAIDRLHSYS